MGASIAFHLARSGVTDVVLLEARELASGSSGKPLGGVRAAFSDPGNIELGARSLECFRRFARDIGVDISLAEVGYLFLLRAPEDVAGFERSVALQNSLGVGSRMIDAAEARRRCPYLSTDGLLGAAFCSDAGYARPAAVVHGYTAAAQRLGVRVVTRCSAVAIETRPGGRSRPGEAAQITAVRTTRGTVTTSTVICAAGAWSERIGAMAGVALPVEPLRRQIALTPPMSPRPPRIPFTIDYDSTFYVHPSDDGLLLGLADPAQAVGFDTAYTQDWLPALRAAAARCAPALADVPLDRGWAGLYEMTPDCNALIGESPDVGRFLYATGFSGHGFLQAPAVGEVVRDLFRGDTPFCDVAPFDARRFAGSPARTELMII